jgi:hypothetical protein
MVFPALIAASELAAHAVRELEEIGISGQLKRQAEQWRDEGVRLAAKAKAMLSTLPS